METWWKEQAVYQIYPMSFCDSNGDGMGDIPGIISKLPYIKSLGVGILWLSPVYRSPGEDNGYDISDYCDIDPKFGTLADMDELIQKANVLGLKIVMDLVINHTSNQHFWFQKSRRREAPYEDYYIWRDGRGKRPPNNWSSFFGGGAWTFDDFRGQYYLHLFAKGQPDLNYRNPAVIEAVEGVMDFWLSRGVSGFRCDVINLLWKDSMKNGFPKGALVGSEYYISRPGCHALLQRFRRNVLSKYDCFTVGETVFVSPKKARELTDPARGELDMVFSFEHMNADCFLVKWLPRKFSPQRFFKSLIKWQKELPWNAVYFENHDQPRSVTRFGDNSPASAKAILTLLLTLRGTPFVYQGEELGMTNFDFTGMDDIQDVESKNMVPTLKKLGLNDKQIFRRMQHASRDNARTPMQWTSGPEGGFTTVTPWLKVNGNHTRINAEAEDNDPDSVLNWFRALMAYRNGSDVLKQGRFRLISREKSWMILERRLGNEKVVVAVNWSPKTARLPLIGNPVLSTHGTKMVDCQLQPWEAVLIEIKPMK
jgi:oligo-1,6-glucosidase